MKTQGQTGPVVNPGPYDGGDHRSRISYRKKARSNFVSVRKISAVCFVGVTEILIEP